MQHTMEKRQTVKLSGFGNFNLRDRINTGRDRKRARISIQHGAVVTLSPAETKKPGQKHWPKDSNLI